MTLNEAIEHLDDILQSDKKWECEECKNEHIQLRDWLNELKSYKDLEEQGKLLKLPCAVGDTVYQIDEFDCELCETERPEINKKCTCKIGDFCGYEKITVAWFKLDMLDDFGKTVFLTREEAEAALKKMEEKKV